MRAIVRECRHARNWEVPSMSMKSDGEAYWHETRKLVFTAIAVWAVFSFAVHLFAVPLNGITILGFPLGYYMAAQGSLIVFVILIFWFCAKQEKLDRDHGVSEE
jgi:putative solute:sodium symporter small subunit